MKLLHTLLLVLALFSVTQGVVISWEESLVGKIDYRFFYLNVPEEDSGSYAKPYFGLVNGVTGYEYGALGSLYCGPTGESIAVYFDANHDGNKVWRCESINVLPFASQPTPISPPICDIGVSTGVPAQWNSTADQWVCGQYNQILTFATRGDLTINCVTADFLMMYGSVDQIRCVSPLDIDPSLTLNGRSIDNTVMLQERVDVRSDKKWTTIMSDYDVTALTARTWQYWRWTPYLNYDSTPSSSLVASPPAPLPFPTTLIAVSFGSFRVSSYNWYALPPSGIDTFTGTASKLSTTLVETPISTSLVFDSISATSGHVTFGLSSNAASNCTAGETFVAGITGKTWAPLTVSSDRHMITITLWLQTTQSFTEYWPVSK